VFAHALRISRLFCVNIVYWLLLLLLGCITVLHT